MKGSDLNSNTYVRVIEGEDLGGLHTLTQLAGRKACAKLHTYIFEYVQSQR